MRRIVSILLTVCLTVCCAPIRAFAWKNLTHVTSSGFHACRHVWSYDGKGWRYRTAKGFLYKTWSLLPWNGEDYWYFFGEEGYMQTGWQLINEKWYYLEQGVGQNQGHLLVNTTTADGYKVDAEGAWIE